MVEQGIENPRVGGSNPSPATTLPFLVLLSALASACGDHCEALCVAVADRVAECRPVALTWADLGATSRADFSSRCRRDWDAVLAELEAHDQTVALDLCDASLDRVLELSCDEIIALYATD